jgi:hypothetical protein
MENFELKESYAPYVSGSNSASLSVADRLPRKVVWSFDGKEFELECSDGLVARNFESNIFVIESPYEIKNNRAYVLAPDKRLIADLPKKSNGASFFYYDILRRDSEAIFLASSNSGDFQLMIDFVTGAVLKIQEFR